MIFPFDTSFAGQSIPRFFYGTAWKGEQTADLTRSALEAGFRAVDTANQSKYYDELAVGSAIKCFLATEACRREDLFIQTKFTYARDHDHRKPYADHMPLSQQVAASFESSLNHLHTSYVDSYILHTPYAKSGICDEDIETWQAMEQLVASQKVKNLGISNIGAEQLRILCAEVKIKPTFVQNLTLSHTRWDADVRTICDQENILYQGFSLLAAKYNGEPVRPIRMISEKLQRTVPQILFRFAYQLGIVCLTGTQNLEHMQSTFEIEDFMLTEEDMLSILRISH